MTNEKRKRLKASIMVGAILLLVIIVGVVIWQQVNISIRKNRIEHLEAEIKRYEQMIAEGEDQIAIRELEEWIEIEARELGYVWESDKKYD